jgi:prepilin-type N-terminal cleavage/methylation domain-containing protein
MRRFGEEGFSLVELLIVVGLMAVMMAIAITGLRSQLPKMHANGTARDIAGKLMMARLKAVQNNGMYGVRFVPGAAGSYVPVKYVAGAWTDDAGATQATTDVTIAVSGALCANSRVEFYQNGTNLGCDTITVTSIHNDQMKITVDLYHTTGNVTVE